MDRILFPKKIAMTALLSCALLLTSCYSGSKLVGGSVKAVSDSLWAYSNRHPDGFTMDVTTMTEPAEGVVVAYAATQGCHSRKQLGRVVRHAIRHDGYVGGWLDTTDSLYYFDSSRLFPEDSLAAAIRFGIENGQIAVFVLSEGCEVRLNAQRDLPPRLLVWQDTLFGLIDGSGKTVLPCEYEGLFTYNDKAYPEGYIIAKRDGLWGIMDWNGRPILPYRYDARPKPIANSGGLFVVCGDDKPGGVVNSKGDTVVPFRYLNLSEFGTSDFGKTSSSPLLIYSVEKTPNSAETSSNRTRRKQLLRGLLDLNGREVLAPVYKNLFCGCDHAIIVTDTNDYEGVMDFKGVWVRPISPLYTYDNYYGDFVSIKERRTRLKGLMSADGSIVLPIEYQEVCLYPIKGLVEVKDRSGLWGLMDTHFRVLIPHRYTELNALGEFGDSYYFYGVLRDGRVEIIDTAGHVVSMDPAIHFDHDNLPYSYPLVYVDSAWRLVDPKGKLLPQRYSEASNYWSSTLMSVATDSLHHGIVDLWGNVVVPLRYVEADADGDDVILARCPSGKVEVLNGKGRKLLSCWGAHREGNVLYVANKNGMWAIADSRTGKRLSRYYFIWEGVNSSSAETCWAVYDTNHRLGYVNARGREILPCSLDEKRAALSGEQIYGYIYHDCSCGELIYPFKLPNGRYNQPKGGC